MWTLKNEKGQLIGEMKVFSHGASSKDLKYFSPKELFERFYLSKKLPNVAYFAHENFIKLEMENPIDNLISTDSDLIICYCDIPFLKLIGSKNNYKQHENLYYNKLLFIDRDYKVLSLISYSEQINSIFNEQIKKLENEAQKRLEEIKKTNDRLTKILNKEHPELHLIDNKINVLNYWKLELKTIKETLSILEKNFDDFKENPDLELFFQI